MLISIIIPVYNEEKFIKEILVRIDKIKGMHKEVIIVNDKSNDDTLNIIQNQCHGIFTKLINNDKNMGRAFRLEKELNALLEKLL